MKFRVLKSFAKDLKKIKDQALLRKVRTIKEDIEGTIDDIEDEDEIPFKLKDTRKISGSEHAYRIKVNNNYRIGAEIDKERDDSEKKERKIFSLKRFLHRKDIYNKFPAK